MLKINVNGTTREMTPEEAAELARQTAEIPEEPRTALEQRIEELEGMLNLLLERYGVAPEAVGNRVP